MSEADPDQDRPRDKLRRALEVLAVATRLGLTSFGGPIAHLGYFRDEYVGRRGWLDDRRYADLVALAQFLPGPASSQVGIAVGTIRAGLLGGVLAWVGFTLPSAVALIAFALFVGSADLAREGWLHGLELVAVAIVLVALSAMARSLAPDARRRLIAIAAAITLGAWQSGPAQVVVLVAGAFIGLALLRAPADEDAPPAPPALSAPLPATPDPFPIGRRTALASLALFGILLVGLPIAASGGDPVLRLIEPFYASGSLIFGGGHVVLPLLSERVVDTGLVDAGTFLSGYGAAQAMPGPLLTFAAYLGAVMSEPPNGIAGGTIALGAIFLPSFLLVFGVLPFWAGIRGLPGAAAALAGVNAAVVGLLAAALYDPIATTAIRGPVDLAFVAGALGLLVVLRLPPWAVVVAGAAAGFGLGALGVG